MYDDLDTSVRSLTECFQAAVIGAADANHINAPRLARQNYDAKRTSLFGAWHDLKALLVRVEDEFAAQGESARPVTDVGTLHNP